MLSLQYRIFALILLSMTVFGDDGQNAPGKSEHASVNDGGTCELFKNTIMSSQTEGWSVIGYQACQISGPVGEQVPRLDWLLEAQRV